MHYSTKEGLEDETEREKEVTSYIMLPLLLVNIDMVVL